MPGPIIPSSEADASAEIAVAAPTFGALLRSVGLAVATSQTALDNGLIESVNQLSSTDITIVTDVIIRLDDNGLPMTPNPATDLITSKVSVLNYFMPTIHEWRRVSMSMDLTIGRFSSQDAFTYERTQYSGSVGGVGLFWGFLGWFDDSSSENKQGGTNTHQSETNFTQGEVRLDALLAPRQTQGFKPPIKATKGPRIVIAQSGTRDLKDGDKLIGRETDLLIHVLKANGGDNAAKTLTLESGGLLPTFLDDGVFDGATTNADGRIKVTLKRTIPGFLFGQPRRYTVTAVLGQIRQPVDITL